MLEMKMSPNDRVEMLDQTQPKILFDDDMEDDLDPLKRTGRWVGDVECVFHDVVSKSCSDEEVLRRREIGRMSSD